MSTVRTNAPLGKIIAVCGSTATMGILPAGLATDDSRTTVSKFVMIHSGRSRSSGGYRNLLNLPPFAKEQGYRAIAELDLMGEIDFDREGAAQFRRGVSDYPVIGDLADAADERGVPANLQEIG